MLVLSFYYHPDLSAGSFRTTALVAALRERAPPGAHFEVLTTVPNRYHTFSLDAPEDEGDDTVHIHRIRLPTHRSDMSGQSRAFLTFARRARAYTRGKQYDIVFATSSRLMTAALGAWISRSAGARLYLDIRDLFVDTISEVLPRAVLGMRYALSALESWTMQRAERINLVSQGFEGYFRARYPRSCLSFFTNGIDDAFLAVEPKQTAAAASMGPRVVLYAGNIGEGQGLHNILPGLARALAGRAHFIVIGDGGRRAALERALQEEGVRNVELRPPVSRERLLAEYREADVLFLHLGALSAFEKVLPSKLFEYAATGKPILAGVAGYAARFVREEIANAGVFAPCSVPEAVRAFEHLRIETQPRPEFIAKFSRAHIARAMADDILTLARPE
ncbi:MAG: glycosyltransferase family 4 protein [Gammaproteobacteria bacterium]